MTDPYAQQPPPAPTGARPGELVDRFVARLLDGLILGVAYVVLGIVVGGLLPFGVLLSTGELLFYNLLVIAVTTALSLGYYGYFESTRGQTLGKQVMKLRVVGPDGQSNPTMEQSLRRNIFLAVGLINILPFFIFSVLAGLASLTAVILIAVGINSDPATRQAWHDRFAGGTRVLKLG